MDVTFESIAERRAAQASDLKIFGGLNLLHIKRQVNELLGFIGSNGIFTEYTKHDISHIDGMLGIVDWIIPSDTADSLTASDWLLLVLSIYFHDMGMLVTRNEYESRGTSTYPTFKKEILENKERSGKDYSSKVSELPPDELERFLYQEFVREHHAERIRLWIEDPKSRVLGAAVQAASEISTLLDPLPKVFRADLGLVCASHHKEDLDDVSRYPISQPYGNTASERANVQYAAIILRTVDLLQVTRDRTPSMTFRILNPADPVSQQEWAKQMSVHAVVPQVSRNADGDVDETVEKHTIEYHASFEDEVGFFALTHYLDYAERQLLQSYQWAKDSIRHHGSKFEFPWRHIDQDKIKTKGFLPEQFRFEIDQTKILDLLTGHTLYNNSNVVVRELTQNAIDAVRLQFVEINGNEDARDGKVRVSWDPQTRLLEVLDNGTGMTQEIIQSNFLKVGSSRYQQKSFRDKHPKFSPISRFGIGVLSAFMLADAVEVVTVHPEEDWARRISLRSVHGKYLIRLIDKHGNDETVSRIGAHGTCIRINIRASSNLPSLVQLVKSWFIFPGCRLEVVEGDQDPITVGFSDPKAALESVLSSYDTATAVDLAGRPKPIKVKEVKARGLSMAYAVQWSPFFKTWEFIGGYGSELAQRIRLPLGWCIEGVKVRGGAPGFSEEASILAIADSTGSNSPRTNVARSDLEDTPQYHETLRKIYGLYLQHIRDEIESMIRERDFSPTRAITEADYLLSSLLTSNTGLRRRYPRLDEDNELLAEINTIPSVVIEKQGKRLILSLDELSSYTTLREVDNEIIKKAETFLAQLPAAISLHDLVSNLSAFEANLPSDPLLIARSKNIEQDILFKRNWEVTRIETDLDKWAIDVTWSRRNDCGSWIELPEDDAKVEARARQFIRELRRTSTRTRKYYVPENYERISGLTRNFIGVRLDRSIYLRSDGEWTELAGLLGINDFKNIDEVRGYALGALLDALVDFRFDRPNQLTREILELLQLSSVDIDAVIRMCDGVKWRVFSTDAVDRREGSKSGD